MIMKHPVSGFQGIVVEPSIFTISAPSGAGKSTLMEMLEKKFPDSLEKTVSSTSRPPRKGEVEGRDYHFISKEEFEKGISEGLFIEWVFLFDTYYGTSKKEMERITSSGKHAVAVIDVVGALRIKTFMPSVSIFIRPPSLEELRKRLEKRGSENSEQIAERIARGAEELKIADQFDHVIVNDDIEMAYRALVSVFIAEEQENRV